MRWVSLFDPGERDHVCELVDYDRRAQALEGYQPRLHQALREILCGDLSAYVEAVAQETECVRLAIEMQFFARELAERVEYRCIRDHDASHLRTLWTEFVAAGAAHRMYHDLPEEAARKKRGGKRSAESRKAKRDHDLEIAAQALARLRQSNDVKTYRLEDLTKPTGLDLARLRKLTMTKISSRADGILRK